jgi:hypothetical protein
MAAIIFHGGNADDNLPHKISVAFPADNVQSHQP